MEAAELPPCPEEHGDTECTVPHRVATQLEFVRNLFKTRRKPFPVRSQPVQAQGPFAARSVAGRCRRPWRLLRRGHRPVVSSCSFRERSCTGHLSATPGGCDEPSFGEVRTNPN